jgi:hypothetical protein
MGIHFSMEGLEKSRKEEARRQRLTDQCNRAITGTPHDCGALKEDRLKGCWEIPKAYWYNPTPGEDSCQSDKPDFRRERSGKVYPEPYR